MEQENQKEIEIMPFMVKATKEQDQKMVNTSQRDPLNNEILGKGELYLRKNNNDPEKRRIFDEVDNRVYHNTSTPKKNLNIKSISKVALATLGLVGLVALCKESSYENKPIKIVTMEMASDSGVALTDNGRKIDGKMTQEELVNYAIEHELTIEQIEEEIANYSKKEMLNKEFVQEKMEEDNPEIFKRL